MKKIFFILTLFFGITKINAHDLNYDKIILHHWNIEKEKKELDASFMMLKDNRVFVEDAQSKILSFPYESLSMNDKQFVMEKQNKIDINNKLIIDNTSHHKTENVSPMNRFIILFCLFLLFGIIVFKFTPKNKIKYIVPLYLIGLSFSFYSFTKKYNQLTNPADIDQAFAPFVPNIHTFFDATYFWVESKGIPTTHPMMTGISSSGWQRQVPIPQCYMGTNAWPIPLNPVISNNPIPVDGIHFTRGAIAIAVNGVPIFNEHTNTGVDALVAGQLDNFGGHCGRADDYHYHIAPLHLYAYTQSTLPIAYALDGFAVFGAYEPDGTSMQTLDANHGHLFNGLYHYHGTTSYPYMIGNMVGQVTEDNTHQLIPQAAANPVRPGQNPLNGALITFCNPNSTGNGYTLAYTYQNVTDSIVYYWDLNGNYTFKYYTGARLDSTQNKHDFVQCNVPITTKIKNIQKNKDMSIYPNPATEKINIVNSHKIKNAAVFDLKGSLLLNFNFNYNTSNSTTIDVSTLSAGTYFLSVTTDLGKTTEKIIIE